MATIVTQYNPWREQLAMSFLGPLVQGMIQRSQIAEENRKLNALMGELAAGEAGMGGPAGTQNAAMGGNPWERSFFQNDAQGGALGQFDAAMGMGGQAPQAGTLNPVADMQRLYQLMASKRFGMVDPRVAMALAQPYLAQRQAAAQAQAAAMAQAQKQAAAQAWGQQFMNTTDPAAQMKQIVLGQMGGHIDKAVVGDYMNWMKHMNPHQQYKSENFGDRITGFAFDPITGQANPVFSGAVGMNPYQAGSLENERARIAETGRHNMANEGLRGQELDETRRRHGALENQWGQEYAAKRDDAMWNRNNPKGSNSGQVTTKDRWEASVKGIDNEIRALEAENSALAKQQDEFDAPPEAAQQRQAQIDANKKRIAELRQQRAEMMKAPQGNAAPIRDVTGLVQKHAGISSRYGKRGSGHHNGTDIMAAEGTPVMSPGTFTVSRIVNDQNGGGYGVNVTLSGKDANGNNVEMLFAHLQPGSVRVKQGQTVNPGDVLAGVGNTGRVRGKNGGYHLHFEVKVNGKNVDPEQYMRGFKGEGGAKAAGPQRPTVDDYLSGKIHVPGDVDIRDVLGLEKAPPHESGDKELNALNGQVKGQSVGPMMQGIANQNNPPQMGGNLSGDERGPEMGRRVDDIDPRSAAMLGEGIKQNTRPDGTLDPNYYNLLVRQYGKARVDLLLQKFNRNTGQMMTPERQRQYGNLKEQNRTATKAEIAAIAMQEGGMMHYERIKREYEAQGGKVIDG